MPAGMDAAKVAAVVFRVPNLLAYPEDTLQRNYDRVLADIGEAEGRLLVRGCLEVLAAKEGRVGLNLQTLQELGASWETAKAVLRRNKDLAARDLQTPKFAARVTFWQQTYNLSAGECRQGRRERLRSVAGFNS